MGWHQTCNRTPKGCQRRPPQATQPRRSEVRTAKGQAGDVAQNLGLDPVQVVSLQRPRLVALLDDCHALMIAVFEKNVLASVWRHADQAVADDTGNPEVTGRVECQSVRKIARAELRDGFASAQCSVFGQLEPRCPPGKGLIDKEMLPGRIDNAFVGVAEAFGCNSGALLVDSYDETIRHIGSGSLVAGMLAGADRDPDIPFVITTNEIGGWQRNSVDFFEERLQRTMAI